MEELAGGPELTPMLLFFEWASHMLRLLTAGWRSEMVSEPLDPLTQREREILELVAAMRTNEEIGEALVISPRTVETHIAHILQKLRAANRREAARMWQAEDQ